MKKPNYESCQQQHVDKTQALQKLLCKPLQKTYLVQKSPQQIPPPAKQNQCLRSPPKKIQSNKPHTNQTYICKLKTSSQNHSIEEQNDNQKQSHSALNSIKSLYGIGTKTNTNSKPIIPFLNSSKSSILSNRPLVDFKDSCDSTSKRIQTSYIDLKSTKEDSTDIYQQMIKMRQVVQQPMDQKQCYLHHNSNAQFSNLEGNQDYCSLCAIDKAYSGASLIYLPTQQTLNPPITKTQINSSLDTLWSVDVMCQQQKVIQLMSQEFLQKKQDLQEFIAYLQKTHEQVQLQTNDYQKYLLSPDINSTSKSQVDLLCQNISKQVKKCLSLEFNPKDQISLKRALPEKIGYLRTFQSDIMCIRNDIVQNIENILKQMELEPFKLILQKYGTKIKTLESTHKISHLQIQNQFGICFGESVMIGENGLANLSKWIRSVLKDDQEMRQKLFLSSQPVQQCKAMYVSFENKESFKNKTNKENDPEQDITDYQLRQSQTTKFVDLLNKINNNQNQKNSFLTSFLAPSTEQSHQINNFQYRDDEKSLSSWRDIQKSPQFKDTTNLFY